MAIKTQYETAEEIPEALREHSVEIDSKFILDIDDIETHPKVNSLRNAFKQEKAKRDGQAQAIADLNVRVDAIPEDFDAERWSQLKLMESKAVDPDEQKEAIRKELESQRLSIKTDLEKKHEVELKLLQGKLDKVNIHLEKTTKSDKLRDGLVAACVAPEFIAAAMALLEPRVKIVEDGDGYRDVVETDMGDITAKEYALQWVQKDEGKHFVKPASGPDLKPKNGYSMAGENPWMPGSINLTQQCAIIKADKKKAARLKAAAGIK